ncbi:MAG: tRNA lysidine(34) synthetase TilS [Bacteroidia bacterium]
MPAKIDFVSNFIQFSQEHKLLEPTDKIIVGISGGPDSIALLTVLHQLNYSIIAAHVNYGLRGDESDADEEFVHSFCSKHNIQLEVLECNTEKISKSTKKGIQETARDIRYEWFEQLCKKLNCNKIATAHHQEDQLESILLNISRGTGIKGLSGIHIKRGIIIRPFLFTDKSSILNYLKEKNIQFRLDSSNIKNKYNRNYLRNEIIPGLKKVNPQIALHAFELSQWAIFYQNNLDSSQKNRIRKSRFKDQIIIPQSEVVLSKTPYYFLMNEIGRFGFTSSQTKDILDKISNHKKGQLYESNTHQLVIDKTEIIIDSIPESFINQQFDELPFTCFYNGIELRLELLDIKPNHYESNKLYLNADLIEFPLELSRINKGDKMTPLGMKGNKKISDILIDEKINKLDKQLCLNLKKEDEILALIPLKINDRFSITKDTKKVLCISLNN